MKRTGTIQTLIIQLAAFLLLAMTTGCVEPLVHETPETAGPRALSLRIMLPGADGLLTKAITDYDIPGSDAERAVHTLQIWAFKHGEEAVLAYQAFTPGNVLENPMKLKLALPDEIMEDSYGSSEPLKLDFYVLVNGPSVGVSDSTGLSTRQQIIDKSFGPGAFGSSLVTRVPEAGLPMSGFFDEAGVGFDILFLKYGFSQTQLDVVETKAINNDADFTNPAASMQASAVQAAYINALISQFNIDSWEKLWKKLCPVIHVTRAVSKVRFVFAKAETMATETKINSISLIDSASTAALSSPMLPVSTFLFPREDGSFQLPGTDCAPVLWRGPANTSGGYNPLVANADFQNKTIDTPLRLRWDSDIVSAGQEKAPCAMDSLATYERFLSAEIAANHALDKVLYLRESGNNDIYCRICYQVGDGEEKEADIRIPAGATFHRNTWWTVYAYFMSYELGFQVIAAPWDGIGSSSNDESHLQ